MRGLGAAIRSMMSNRGNQGKIRKFGIASIDPDTGSPRPGSPEDEDVLYIMWEPSQYRDPVTSGFDEFIRQNGGRVHIVAIVPQTASITDMFIDSDGNEYKIVNKHSVAKSHDELLVVEV